MTSLPLPASNPRRRSILCLLLAAWALVAAASRASALCCVWRVTDDAGHTLYVAGSVHSLRATDYPLPAPYETAYRASAALAFEHDPADSSERFGQAWRDAARYPSNGRLKDHVDPRTYAYILRVIGNVHGSTEPEKRIEHLRPWAIMYQLESSNGLQGLSRSFGVEAYLTEKARRDHKTMVGLVPLRDHIAVFGKMNDADSEAALLLAFIHLNTGDKTFQQTVVDWKRGDVAGVERMSDEEFRDAPGLRRRMLSDRNAAWMPKIEGYLRSGKTWMVVAGAAHMAGGDGVPALLRARGYHVEQL